MDENWHVSWSKLTNSVTVAKGKTIEHQKQWRDAEGVAES